MPSYCDTADSLRTWHTSSVRESLTAAFDACQGSLVSSYEPFTFAFASIESVFTPASVLLVARRSHQNPL